MEWGWGFLLGVPRARWIPTLLLISNCILENDSFYWRDVKINDVAFDLKLLCWIKNVTKLRCMVIDVLTVVGQNDTTICEGDSLVLLANGCL